MMNLYSHIHDDQGVAINDAQQIINILTDHSGKSDSFFVLAMKENKESYFIQTAKNTTENQQDSWIVEFQLNGLENHYIFTKQDFALHEVLTLFLAYFKQESAWPKKDFPATILDNLLVTENLKYEKLDL